MKFRKLLSIIASLFVLIMNVVPVYAFSNQVHEDKLAAMIDDYIDERKEATASVSLGVFKEGEVIYEDYYGYMDIENGLEASSASVYEWGSVSKVLIWVSVMQLVEAGKINLDEDIRNYFPEDFKAKLHYQEVVTMRDLMNHQGGFQEITYPIEYEKAEAILELEDLLIKSEPVQIYQPGTVTAYSNWSAALAAYVVESIESVPFYEYVKENIFVPLGMEHTSIKADWSDNPYVQDHRNLSKSYYYTLDEKTDLGSSIMYIGLYPAGACAGTLGDYLKFTREFTSNETKLFVHPETLAEMREASLFYANGDERGHHGLWSIDSQSHLIGHGGNTQGYSSAFWFDPVTNTGYAVMTNEVAETTYNYGLAELLFGKVEATPAYGEDISGIYTSKRTIDKGFARCVKYLGGILPISKTEKDHIYKLSIGDIEIKSMGEGIYRFDTNNGLAYNVVKLPGENYLQNYTADYEKIPNYELVIVIVLVIGMLWMVLASLFSVIRAIVRSFKKKPRTVYQKNNDRALILAGIISTIFFYLWLGTGSYNPGGVTFLSLISSILSIIIIANLIHQIYNRKEKNNTLSDLVTALFLLIPVFSVIFFQIYNFWS